MTPHELNIHIEEYHKLETYKHRERITAAYMNAHFQRLKKLPDLDKVFGDKPKEKKKEQTPADMLAEVIKLNAALGGTTY